jgi:hypothetical protein
MKKNLPLIIGLALPIIFIIIIAAVVYWPSNFVNPKHNFVYLDQSYGSYLTDIVVVEDKITTVSSGTSDMYAKQPTIYLYDFSKNASYEITLEEAKQLSVTKGPASPDGYSIGRNNSHSGIFEIFGSYEDNSGYFISSPDGAKRKLTGIQGEYYYELNVIGWVK